MSSPVIKVDHLTKEYTLTHSFPLNDVSFEVQRGERVGKIGRNGAGKSTLLKVLSRITEPTSGRIEIAGGVASVRSQPRRRSPQRGAHHGLCESSPG